MACGDIDCPACGRAMTPGSMVRGFHYIDGSVRGVGGRLAVVDDEWLCTWTCYCQGAGRDPIAEHRNVPVVSDVERPLGMPEAHST